MSTEMFSGSQIKQLALELFGLQLEFRLYFYTDHAAHCQKFVQANWAPEHWSDDIFKRDFDQGKIWCEGSKAMVDMPRQGIDLYVCGFPCGPWSLRGNKWGFDDKASECCWYAIRTIKVIKPSIFILENVTRITQSSSTGGEGSDFDQIAAFARQEIPDYASVVMHKLCCTSVGYPTVKNRVKVLGGRLDQMTQVTI